jgi:hypothetical protein
LSGIAIFAYIYFICNKAFAGKTEEKNPFGRPICSQANNNNNNNNNNVLKT